MSFSADKQTQEDLNLLGKFRENSIFSIFNKVVTAGGEQLLNQMFSNPLNDAAAINDRVSLFRYFQELKLKLPYDPTELTLAENFFESHGSSNMLNSWVGAVWRKTSAALYQDEEYIRLKAGISAALSVLKSTEKLAGQVDTTLSQKVKTILADKRLQKVRIAEDELSLSTIARLDYLLRYALREEMSVILQFIYQTDVCIAVSDVARSRNYTYPKALPADKNIFKADDIRHPSVKGAIANSLSLSGSTNMLFLTGANMAGKSTFMKSAGITVYLAHMGFPVPANNMEFSVLDGIYSSINVPDNLDQGYSHFYAEVQRVKKVAEEVSKGKNMFVLFDELYKGTNVKDAYDATLACTEAFAHYRNCFFVISTHIIEVGEALRTKQANIRFAYMPTIMELQVPRYTYKMTDGITSDRHGMVIIENEKIPDIMEAWGG